MYRFASLWLMTGFLSGFIGGILTDKNGLIGIGGGGLLLLVLLLIAPRSWQHPRRQLLWILPGFLLGTAVLLFALRSTGAMQALGAIGSVLITFLLVWMLDTHASSSPDGTKR